MRFSTGCVSFHSIIQRKILSARYLKFARKALVRFMWSMASSGISTGLFIMALSPNGVYKEYRRQSPQDPLALSAQPAPLFYLRFSANHNTNTTKSQQMRTWADQLSAISARISAMLVEFHRSTSTIEKAALLSLTTLNESRLRLDRSKSSVEVNGGQMSYTAIDGGITQ